VISRTDRDGGGISTGKAGALGAAALIVLTWANARFGWGLHGEDLAALAGLLGSLALWGIRRAQERR